MIKAKLKTWTAALLALTAITAPVIAAEPALKVGDRAPKLENRRWVQGDAVNAFEPGKAYLIEFWATWCPPCRACIPHVNDLYTKYKDKGFVVIGQDFGEQDEARVEPFIKSMGDKMAYRVGIDERTENKKGKTVERWMSAARLVSIPCAFLVDTKGMVAWIGDPRDLKEGVIEQVLAGKYDLQKAAAAYEPEFKKYEKNFAAQQAYEKDMEPAQARAAAMSRAMREQKWDEALDDLTAAEKLLPENHRALMMLNLESKRFTILLAKKDYPSAYQLAARMGDEQKDNAGVLNYLAWQIVSDKSIEKPDLALAETLINRANEAARGKDPEILDTQARVLFVKGKKDAAIETQTRAVALAEPAAKAAMQTTLDSYKKGELPRGN